MISVVLTVYNREELVLLNTLMGLAKNKPDEIVIVDDGSTVDYGTVRRTVEGALPVKWVRAEKAEGCYNLDGYNNPARAFNVGIEASTGDVLVLMSSDVMLQPGTFSTMLKRDLEGCAWTPSIVDLDSGQQYLGTKRLYPMPWCMGTLRSNVPLYDEGFMNGLAWEDNDIAAEIGVRTGKIIVDCDLVGWHQSHPPHAYQDGGEGFRRNEAYIMQKWRGRPWANDQTDPLLKRVVQVAGCLIVSVSRVPVEATA